MYITTIYHNMQIDIDNNNKMIISDLISGKYKVFKIKYDKYSDFCYKVQKTQIITRYEHGCDLLSDLMRFIPARLAEMSGFTIDYNY